MMNFNTTTKSLFRSLLLVVSIGLFSTGEVSGNIKAADIVGDWSRGDNFNISFLSPPNRTFKYSTSFEHDGVMLLASAVGIWTIVGDRIVVNYTSRGNLIFSDSSQTTIAPSEERAVFHKIHDFIVGEEVILGHFIRKK